MLMAGRSRRLAGDEPVRRQEGAIHVEEGGVRRQEGAIHREEGGVRRGLPAGHVPLHRTVDLT